MHTQPSIRQLSLQLPSPPPEHHSYHHHDQHHHNYYHQYHFYAYIALAAGMMLSRSSSAESDRIHNLATRLLDPTQKIKNATPRYSFFSPSIVCAYLIWCRYCVSIEFLSLRVGNDTQYPSPCPATGALPWEGAPQGMASLLDNPALPDLPPLVSSSVMGPSQLVQTGFFTSPFLHHLCRLACLAPSILAHLSCLSFLQKGPRGTCVAGPWVASIYIAAAVPSLQELTRRM
jgi:hypothetical protein